MASKVCPRKDEIPERRNVPNLEQLFGFCGTHREKISAWCFFGENNFRSDVMSSAS